MAEWTLPFLDRAQATGTFGVVAASHKLATQTAMGVLERGGNAFDGTVSGTRCQMNES
jgi:gamma-glutamyltranspeptidase/glutathione hydrolase